MKTATIETDKGTISLELFDDKVPGRVRISSSFRPKGFTTV